MPNRMGMVAYPRALTSRVQFEAERSFHRDVIALTDSFAKMLENVQSGRKPLGVSSTPPSSTLARNRRSGGSVSGA